MTQTALYDLPELYDRLVPPGPCERFYGDLATAAGSLLELGCGTGRLTVPLAGIARRVVGLDASEAMLSTARRKARAAGAPVRFVAADMRSFQLEKRFDLVIVSCNSLAHMTGDEDLAAAFGAIRRHLAPGGRFAFDVVNPKKAFAASGREVVKRAHSTAGLRVRERAAFDPERRVREARWRVESAGGDVVELAPLRLRQFAPDELETALSAAGLRLVERFGDFDRRPFRASSSRSFIGVAALA